MAKIRQVEIDELNTFSESTLTAYLGRGWRRLSLDGPTGLRDLVRHKIPLLSPTLRQELLERLTGLAQEYQRAGPYEASDCFQLALGRELMPIWKHRTRLLRRLSDDFQKLGLRVPPLRLREGTLTRPREFVIICRGATICRGEIWLDHHLASGAAEQLARLDGEAARSQGQAKWIPSRGRHRAVQLGCTLQSPVDVLAEQLSIHLGPKAAESLGIEEVDRLLTRLPSALRREVRQRFDLLEIRRLFLRLLVEGISLRPLQRIVQAIVREGSVSYAAVLKELGLAPNPEARSTESEKSHEIPETLALRWLGTLQ